MFDGWGISSKMSLDLTDGKSTMVQVMAWCRQATSHYLSQCWPRSVSPYQVISSGYNEFKRYTHLCISNLQVGLDCFQNGQPRCVFFIFWSRCEQVEQNGKEILAKLCKLSTILIWRGNKMPLYIITRAMKLIEVRTKRPTYWRQHVQMYFVEWQSIKIFFWVMALWWLNILDLRKRWNTHCYLDFERWVSVARPWLLVLCRADHWESSPWFVQSLWMTARKHNN